MLPARLPPLGPGSHDGALVVWAELLAHPSWGGWVIKFTGIPAKKSNDKRLSNFHSLTGDYKLLQRSKNIVVVYTNAIHAISTVSPLYLRAKLAFDLFPIAAALYIGCSILCRSDRHSTMIGQFKRSRTLRQLRRRSSRERTMKRRFLISERRTS